MSGRGAERILELIEWLATRGDRVALAEVTQALDLPKSSTLLLLRTLVDRRYVERGPDGLYALVRVPGEASSERQAWGTVLRVAQPILQEAVGVVEETGFIAILTPDRRIRYLNKILPPTREIRYDRDISVDRIAHHVASGLVLLAGLPDAELDRYIADLVVSGEDDPDGVRSAIARARTDGAAVNLRGRVEGAAGIAALVRDSEGKPVAAVNFAGPRARIEDNLATLLQVGRETAERVSAELARRNTTTNKIRRKQS